MSGFNHENNKMAEKPIVISRSLQDKVSLDLLDTIRSPEELRSGSGTLLVKINIHHVSVLVVDFLSCREYSEDGRWFSSPTLYMDIYITLQEGDAINESTRWHLGPPGVPSETTASRKKHYWKPALHPTALQV